MTYGGHSHERTAHYRGMKRLPPAVQRGADRGAAPVPPPGREPRCGVSWLGVVLLLAAGCLAASMWQDQRRISLSAKIDVARGLRARAGPQAAEAAEAAQAVMDHPSWGSRIPWLLNEAKAH